MHVDSITVYYHFENRVIETSQIIETSQVIETMIKL